MPKSFYDLDFIIEINEKRDEQFRLDYEKITSKISNIVIIYSALSFFIIPIVQDICEHKISSNYFNGFAIAFSILFIISFIFTILFLVPKNIDTLNPPNDYYTDGRADLEPQHTDINNVIDTTTVDKLLKIAYITELEESISNNLQLVSRKQGYYNRAFTIALISIVPFVFCLYFHVNVKDDKVQKVRIDNLNKCCIFVIDTTKENLNNIGINSLRKTIKNGKIKRN